MPHRPVLHPILRPLAAALLLTLGAASAQAPGDVRLALVIGNSAYPAPATLANPANDAKAMGDTLRGLGFEVTEVRDATQAQMQQAIAKVREQLKGKQGIGMLYYAGHGLQLDWRNYMVPVDARLSAAADVTAQTVDVNAVTEAFKAAGNRMNILVLDACRDNPFTSAAGGKGLAQLDAPPGTILAYATAPGNVAADGTGSNGLYTQFLLQELVKPQSKIEDVFKRTRFAVRKASGGKQIPWESTSLEEDFMFNAGKLVAAPRPDNRAKEQALALEKTDWERARVAGTADAVYAFLAKYPSGNYNELAQLHLERLQQAQVVAQADRDGKQQSAFAARHRDGDQFEITWNDGLTGQEVSRSRFVLKQTGPDRIENATLSGPAVPGVFNTAGFILSDVFGTYDPPIPAIPGGELKLGNRTALRTVLTLANGSTTWVDWESRVVARERIRTPLGELDTYRLVSNSISQHGIRSEVTLWMEPDWGQAVRIRVDLRRGNAPPDIRVREVVARARKS